MSSIEIRVAGRYILGEKLFEGPHSSIYMGRNAQSHNEVAIKCEPKASKHKFLQNESTVLSELQGSIGMPNLLWHGPEEDFYFMVTDLLGNNLQDYFQICKRRFSLKTVLMIADQILSNIEYLHYKSYLHRDIKPENFAMGLGKKLHQIYTLDLGFSTSYINQQTNSHVAKVEGRKSRVGSLRYASVNVHKGCLNSRRDDLESLGYMLIYFLRGSLPWSGIKATSLEAQNNHIIKLKDISPEFLCKDLPHEFEKYMTHVRKLQYDETPDYSYLKRLLKQKLISEGYEYDFVYDWILIPLRWNDEISTHIPLDTRVRIDDGTNLSKCNYFLDPSDKAEESKVVPTRIPPSPLIEDRNPSKHQRKPSASYTPTDPKSKVQGKKGKKDDCLLF